MFQLMFMPHLSIVVSLLERCPSLTAETDVNVAGNSANSVTNSSTHQTGGSPSPSSSPPLSMAALGPQAIPRRHAPADVIARQGSFRGFPALSQKTSPFKRQMSLRMNELPSTMQRKSDFPIKNTGEFGILTNCPADNLQAQLSVGSTLKMKRKPETKTFLICNIQYCITWTHSQGWILFFLLMQ